MMSNWEYMWNTRSVWPGRRGYMDIIDDMNGSQPQRSVFNLTFFFFSAAFVICQFDCQSVLYVFELFLKFFKAGKWEGGGVQIFNAFSRATNWVFAVVLCGVYVCSFGPLANIMCSRSGLANSKQKVQLMQLEKGGGLHCDARMCKAQWNWMKLTKQKIWDKWLSNTFWTSLLKLEKWSLQLTSTWSATSRRVAFLGQKWGIDPHTFPKLRIWKWTLSEVTKIGGRVKSRNGRNHLQPGGLQW